MKRFLKSAGKVGSWFISAVFFLLIIMNLLLIGSKLTGKDSYPKAFGWSTAVVLSGSMADAINVDDYIIIHEQKQYDIEDIISFEQEGMLITHRIVGKTQDGFVTKGDANDTEDNHPVKEEEIVGKVVMVIPGVGKVFYALQTPLGMLILLITGVFMIELPTRIEMKKQK